MIINSRKLAKRLAAELHVGTGVLVGLIGAPVLLGVNRHSGPVSPYWAPWSPMHQNSALGFLAVGIAWIAMARKRYGIARGLAAVMATLGAATFLQCVFGFDLGLDHLFGFLVTPAPVPTAGIGPGGHMAPSSALCFFALGLAIYFMAQAEPSARHRAISAICGSIPAAIGAVTLIGYFRDGLDSLDPGSFVHISVPTAIGLIVAGSALALHTLRALARSPSDSYYVLPCLATIGLLFGFLALWQLQLNRDAAYQTQIRVREVGDAKTQVKALLKQVSSAMRRFGTRLEYFGLKDKEYLRLDSQSYVEQLTMLRRIGLTDTHYNVVWSYPTNIQNQVAGFDEALDPLRREALEDSRLRHAPSLSRAITLRSGGIGFLLPVALYDGTKFMGILYGTVQADKLFADLVNPSEYQVVVREGERQLFASTTASPAVPEQGVHTTLDWGKTSWTIELRPTESFVSLGRSTQPYFILISGCFLSFLFGAFLLTLFKSREEAVQAAERDQLQNVRLGIALEAASMGAWSADLRTGHIWRSENHDLIFGFDHRQSVEFLPDLFSQVIPEDRERVVAEYEADQQGRPLSRFVFRIRRAGDGAIRWIVVLNKGIVDDLGQVKQLVGVVRDITDEKQEELARQQDHEWRNAVLHAANYAIISTDPQGIIQTFNRAASEMLGYEAHELVGRTSAGVLHLPSEVLTRAQTLTQELGYEVVPGFESLVKRARNLNRADESEWTYVRKDGSTLPVRLSISVLRGPKGEVAGYLGIAMDLTEQRKSQQQLMVVHDRLGRVIEATGEGIWERNFSDSNDIEFIDSQAKRMFGFDPEQELNYEQVASLIPENDRATLAAVIAKHIEQNTPRFSAEFRIQNPHGSGLFRWIRSKGRVEKESGRPRRLVATVGDVTQEIQNRDQLKDALIAAEEAGRAKADFLANMSHEIRTPLNGVIGMADLLMETTLDNSQRTYAGIIQQSGSSLLALINDILDFSKIEAGKLELEKINFSLSQVVEGQADVLIAKAREKGLSLMTYISSDLPPDLIGDPGRIGQIILNLAGNAIKFSATGGVSVRVEPVGVPRLGEVVVRFEVEDTGVGLTEAAQTKLFRPFVQGDESTARKYGGTGLGLSICKRLVESMNGRIGVESSDGQGSRFWFEIPFAIPSGARARSGCPESLVSPENLRVLVLDDDLIASDIIHRYVLSWGMRNGQLSSYADAIGLLKREIERGDPYAVAVIGHGLGSDTGFRLAAQIRAALGPQAPKLILMSQFDQRISDEALRAAAFDQGIRKPVKQSSLLDAFVRALNGEVSPPLVPLANLDVCDLSLARGFRILVADDVSANQMLTLKILEGLGHHAHAVANGKEVLEAMTLAAYDLILMDCQMPEMDGFEATRQIRQLPDPALRRIPIVALTANAMSGDDKKCLAAGMDDYLSKPIKKDRLRAKLEQWLKLKPLGRIDAA